MKKKHSKNWGGTRPSAGRKPCCGLCKLLVTSEQLAVGDAFHFSDGNYYHQECLQDQMRQPDDAYYRDESGAQPNKS